MTNIEQRLYYEPVHDEATHTRLAAAFAARGYTLTSDENEDTFHYIVVEGDGSSLSVNIGDWGAGLEPIGEYASPEEYATAICDWFGTGTTDGVTEPASRTQARLAAARHIVRHYMGHLHAACERAEVAVGLRFGETRDDALTLRQAVRDMDDEVQRLRKKLAEIGPEFDTVTEDGAL